MSNAALSIVPLKDDLITQEASFKMALPAEIPANRFLSVVQTAILTNPLFEDVPRQAFFSACLASAKDGLLPDGKEAALVAFKTKNGVQIKYIPMAFGILKKVRNSGELGSLSLQVVYKEDIFEYWFDEFGDHLKHVPNLNGPRKDIIYAYAIARTKDKEVYLEVMTQKEVEQARSVSRAQDGPWFHWYAEMAKKTVFRRLSKRLPMSSDLHRLVQQDDDMYDFEKPKLSELNKRFEDEPKQIEATVTLEGQAALPMQEVKAMSVFGPVAPVNKELDFMFPEKIEEYKIGGGPFAGRKLEDLIVDELSSYMKELRLFVQANPANKKAPELLKRVSLYATMKI